MKYRLLLVKRVIEDLLMLPLIGLGRLLASLKPLEKNYRVFYFFPFYHTGGAEKIHALVATATGGKDSIIFFTRKSYNEAFLSKFKESGCEIKDISRYTDNNLIYFINIIFRGVISAYINRQQTIPVVFNGQCNFGYKLSPWIKKNIKQIELIHSISSFSYIRIPFLPFIYKTVMISKTKIDEHFALYQRFSIPASYKKKIQYIANTSEFETFDASQKNFEQHTVLYSGRATAEKRPHLVAAIAEKVYELAPCIQFIMAGDDFATLDKHRYPFIEFRGNVTDQNTLKELYQRASILLITSSTEGFPLAVIEGMAYGAAIIATPVGDLPIHIKPHENGFILSTVADEKKIIGEATSFILQLIADKSKRTHIAETNITYAQHTFAYEQFKEAYQKLLFT